MKRYFSGLLLLAAAAASSLSAVAQSPAKFPALKTQGSVTAVVDEHLDALNRCDWNRLMAQYPKDVEIFAPGGTDVIGREKVGEMFTAVTKPFAQGGVCGLKFEKIHSLLVGNTLVIHWKLVGNALVEPYQGTDAYITRDGLMASQVTTFVWNDIKFRK